MPAKSQDQQQAMAIAEHAPDQLYDRNKGLLKMSKSQLHDFAATPRSNLPMKVQKTENFQKKRFPRPEFRQRSTFSHTHPRRYNKTLGR